MTMEGKQALPPNFKEVAPDAFTHPPYSAPKPVTANQKAN
jgi:hypothetical protein